MVSQPQPWLRSCLECRKFLAEGESFFFWGVVTGRFPMLQWMALSWQSGFHLLVGRLKSIKHEGLSFYVKTASLAPCLHYFSLRNFQDSRWAMRSVPLGIKFLPDKWATGTGTRCDALCTGCLRRLTLTEAALGLLIQHFGSCRDQHLLETTFIILSRTSDYRHKHLGEFGQLQCSQ